VAACRTRQARNDQRADPLPRSITLEIPRSLLASLRDLARTAYDGGGDALDELLDALVHHLDTSIRSYRGLQLTVSRDGSPVVLTAFPDRRHGHLATSLRVPLALLDYDFDAASRIVFYAGVPGAFVDLAADLEFILQGGNIAVLAAESARPRIQLDVDAAPPTRGFRLSGLAELTAIERAVGVLMGQGRSHDDALETLRRDAARAGVELHAWAAEVLLRTHNSRLE